MQNFRQPVAEAQPLIGNGEARRCVDDLQPHVLLGGRSSQTQARRPLALAQGALEELEQ